MAATKTYTAQLSVLYMLSLELARLTGLAPWRVEELGASLSSTPRLAREALMINDKPIESLAYRFRQSNYFFLLGSGPNYATALEGALKLKETCNIYAEGLRGEGVPPRPDPAYKRRDPINLHSCRGGC